MTNQTKQTETQASNFVSSKTLNTFELKKLPDWNGSSDL
jgi:hypothetical protein